MATRVLVRRSDGRVAGGVCAGLGPALGVDAAVLRVAALVLALAGGAGAVAYAAAWLVLPLDDAPAPRRRRSVLDAAAVLAVALGATLTLRAAGAWFSDAAVVPVALAGAGAVVVWGRRPGERPLRVAVGVTLVFVGAVAAVASTGDVDAAGRSAGAAALVVVGVALLLGPFLSRLTGELATERRERIRSQERAELAAHLHDGVLQTLALIQRRAADEREVRSLARRQERELREWLFGFARADGPDTVATFLQQELAEVEDRFGVRIDAVTVGDAPLDEAGRALVLAGREAASNAARHAGVDVVDAYLEIEPSRMSLFVRDRGVGFDPRRVPRDRRGLTESVRGRIRRVGGRAIVRSAPGEGTEVELSVSRAVAPARPPAGARP